MAKEIIWKRWCRSSGVESLKLSLSVHAACRLSVHPKLPVVDIEKRLSRPHLFLQAAFFRSPPSPIRGARTSAKRVTTSRGAVVRYPLNERGPLSPQQSSGPPAGAPQRTGFLGAIADGLAHGVGWAFGMRAVDALFGSRRIEFTQNPGTESDGTTVPGGSASYDSEPHSVSSQSGDGHPEVDDAGFRNQFGQSDMGQEGWQWGSDDSSSDSGWGDFDLGG